MSPDNTAFSDGFAWFGASTTADCTHRPNLVGDRKQKDLSTFQRTNALLGKL